MGNDNKTRSLSNRLSRRSLLWATGSASIAALTGCLGDGDGQSSPDGQDSSSDQQGSDDSDSTDNSESTDDTDDKRGGTFLVALSGQPVDRDPVQGLGVPSSIVGSNYYSVLYTYDPELKLAPDDLAVGMPEVERDGARYIVEIVDDATFHNGEPVTAEDVRYSFQAPLDAGTWVASSWTMIENMEVIDEQTLQFDLEFTYGDFPHALGSMEIVPKAVHEEDPEAFAEDPVGSGPFQLDAWQENELARVVRWDDYWGDRDPYVDAIEFTPVPENTTRITEFKQNQHLLQDIPPKLYGTAENIDDATTHETPSLSYTYAGFNLNEGETTKPKVREAIDYCFDMDEVVERFVEPAGVRQYQPLPIETAKAWDVPVDEFESMAVGKDIAQAQSLFEEADVPDGWECTMLCPPDDVNENLMITIANGMEDAGVDASVQRLDWGTFLEAAYTGSADDYNMYTLGWSLSPAPSYQIYNMYHEQGAGENHGHYWSDPEVMDMIDQFRETVDYDRRRELLIEIQKEVVSQRVQIPGWNPKAVWATKDSVQNFSIHPIPAENPRVATQWNNIWLEE